MVRLRDPTDMAIVVCCGRNATATTVTCFYKNSDKSSSNVEKTQFSAM